MGAPRNELGAQRAEQFPHLGNYTLTPAANPQTKSSDLGRESALYAAIIYWVWQKVAR